MNAKIIIFSIFAAFLTVYAQQIHIPSYFPIQDNGRWIYKDEFENYDTATMKTNTTFLQETNIEISFSQNEKQYFRADIMGLRMLDRRSHSQF